MKLLILAKSATAVATGRGIPLDSLRHAASRAIPRDGDRIEFRSDRMTDKGPATGTVKTIKPTVDGFYVTVEFSDGQATLSWDDMGAERVKPGLWMVKSIDAKYQRLLARRTAGTPEGMAAEDARLRDLVERCTGLAAVEAIRAADAEARAKVREDFGIEYASEGGYAAEVIDFHGLQVVIENPVGSVRAGIDPDGKPWATVLTASYGYISGTEGADGDMVDVFIGPDASSTTAYVARCQVAGKWGAYDEDKVMLGFPSEEAAREAFLQNYNDPRFLGGLDVMSIDKLKERLGKPGRLAKSLLIFTKAHVGPYLRGGKLVNLSGYQGRPARARATAGQMGLFADLPPAEKPKRKKADDMTRFDHETTGDLFADADEHGEVPPGRRIMPSRDTVTESRQELIAEHEHLVDVLRSPSHEDDKAEAEKQAAELAEYKQGAASKASETRARRRAVLDLLGEGWKAKAGSEGAKDAYSKNFKQPDGGRIEVTILPQRTVDGNFYVGSYQHGGKRPGAGGFKYAMSMEEAKAIAEDMGKTKPVLLFSGERKSANAQNSLTTASSRPKVEVSEPSDTARRESGAQEKKMSKPWYRSFKEWYDDADMPEKQADGTWVDLETGLPFVDPASFKAEKPIPEKKRADAGMKLDELRDRCARLVKGQAKAVDRAKANGLNPEAIAAAEAAVAEGLRLLQGKAKKADFQAHADLNAEASRKLNAAHSGPKNAPAEAPPKASDDVLAAVDAALSAVEPKPAKAEVDPAELVAPTGYTLTRENGEIVLRGPWSDDLHARLKRAGGKWEGSGHGTGRVGRKAWIIPEDKASSLKRIFANVGDTLASEDAGRKAAAQAEAEKDAAAKAEADRKQAEARAAAPTIAPGTHGPFTVRAVSGGYRVMFAYDSARVAQIKANGGKKFDPVDKSWFVDAADAGKLQSILERAKAAAATAPAAPASSAAPASARKPRVLFPLSTMPRMGVPVTWHGRTVGFESKGEPFRINEDHPSLHGSHLLGYEGDRGAYAYYRDATPEEVQGMQADKNAPAEKSWGYSEDAVKRALEGRD